MMALITFWAGYLQVVDSYIPQGQYLLAVLAILAMVMMAFVFAGAFRKWHQLMQVPATKTDAYGETVKEIV